MHSIYGYVELENGLTIHWLRFINGLTLEEAKTEAVRLVSAAWKGAVVRCWAA